jgi:hypothetical protein
MNTIITTPKILFFPIVNIIILFILGFGVAQLIIPKQLKRYYLWLTPWVTIITSIFFLVIASLFGLSVKQANWPLILSFLLVDIYVLFVKRKIDFKLDVYKNFFVAAIVLLSLTLNLSPLIRSDRILTTVSLGNNDIIAYTTVGDYLKDHSISESFKTKVDATTDNLLHDGYRWGTPIINSFFLSLLNVEGYQYTYASQVVLFALFIPLVFILFEILFRQSLLGTFIVTILTGFNVNLLYMLYHDFFGQVLFWGLESVLIILFYCYLHAKEINKNKFNLYDFLLGITITVLYFSYHEPAIFMFAPVGLFVIFKLIFNRRQFVTYIQALIRIGLISLISGSISIVNAIIFDFKQAFMGNPNQPIGWQLFREKIPFANPFEAMGFYSIHNFEPLPLLAAVILSIIVVFIIIKGVLNNKYKLLTICYLIIFILFLYWTGVHHANFFDYNRALTYTLSFMIILFSIGLNSLYEKQKHFWSVVIVILISLEIWSGVNLNKRFIKEHLSVEKSYISILDLKKKNIKEPIYAESFIEEATSLWKQIWIGYFLYSKNISLVPTIFDSNQFENRVPDNSLILISKSTPWLNSLKVIYRDIIWSNEYYDLGHLCNTDDCLIESKYRLDGIKIGKNEFEDSLLINGWNIGEGETRWANEKESTLRLVTKESYPTSLTVEALSLAKPQEITVYINDKLLGTVSIDTEWKSYSLPINYPLDPGVHRIKFTYSQGYRPMDVFPGNLDSRTLYVNFKNIALK